jgi:hypothetical protein
LRNVDALTFDYFVANYQGILEEDFIDDMNRHEVAFVDKSLPFVDQLQAVVCYLDDGDIYYIND